MSMFRTDLKPIVAAAIGLVMYSMPLAADGDRMDELFDRLQRADDSRDAAQIEQEIQMEWRKSGSPAMDLLHKRGRDALERRDFDAAIEHFGALIDHAPDYAEGWHGRARAFFAKGHHGLAVADLERALALDPRQYEALFGLGVILEQLDRPGPAYDAFGLVLQLHPHHERAAAAIKRLDRGVNGVEL
ncbi:MAG: Tetratricopeptide repeat/TPR repeat [Rhodobacteraceae bacterium HLUCCO07]|nr:MAG: Tetratricopeptide repeat/TPR repeat [Rhodobacteraceae bacterium HLUCCO07]